MSENTALQRVETGAPAPAPAPSSNALITFDREQLDVLKSTVASGTSDAEFALFVQVCQSTGLNPFQRQIYAIVRDTWNPQTRQKEPKMTIQTGIDGYRLIAARTGQHAGTDDAVFGPEDDAGHPAWAQVTVYRFLPNGYKAPFTATARWSEYCQSTRDGKLTGMWSNMPYGQLAKCAESLALRKAFPAELSGVYTREEMAQADSEEAEVVSERSRPPRRRGGEGRGQGGRRGYPGESLHAGPTPEEVEAARQAKGQAAPASAPTQAEIMAELVAALDAVEAARLDGDPAEVCMEPVDLLVSSVRGWPEAALDFARRCGREVCRGEEPRLAIRKVSDEVKAEAAAAS